MMEDIFSDFYGWWAGVWRQLWVAGYQFLAYLELGLFLGLRGMSEVKSRGE